MIWARSLAAGVLTAGLACSSYPTAEEGGRFEHTGAELESRVLGPSPYLHAVFVKRGCRESASQPRFVFLDGDGASWMRAGRVSADPTPREPVALDLLVRESSCGAYVSRPCTFGLADRDARCSPTVWSVDRYSAQVVSSLEASVAQLSPGRPLVLVGFSGGGWIAAHLANRIERVVGVVTLGANLDLADWVDHHGYTTALLERSLESPLPLRDGVAALHVVGEADRVSPPALTRRLLGPQAPSLLSLEGVDHTCCWDREWPRIREALDASLAHREPAGSRP